MPLAGCLPDGAVEKSALIAGGEMSSALLIELSIAGMAVGCIYSLIAIGFTLIIRATGVLHFAQGEIVMLGAMSGLTAYSIIPLPFLAILLVGIICGGLVALLLELVIYRTLRLRRVPLNNIIIATVGVSILLQNVSQIVWGSEPIHYPPLFSIDAYTIGPAHVRPQTVWIIGIALVVMILLQLFLAYTRTGRAMRAVAQDADTAPLMGINLTRITAYTFFLAGLLGGAAGVLLGSLYHASFGMGFIPGLKAFVAAALGGLGSLGGAMAGGLIFGLIETFSSATISSAYRDAVGMLLLIIILLIWPQGLVGLIRRRS